MYRYISLAFLFLFSFSFPVEAARKKKEAVPEKSEETIFMETYFPERPFGNGRSEESLSISMMISRH